MILERRNAYFCSHCRKVTITVDIDEGVTPMFIRCIYCKEQASSFMYQLPGCFHFNIEPDLEWYKPTGEEYKGLSKAFKEHIDKGGLNMRKRTKAKPITREIK
jgi:hypothetical protein